MTISEDISQIRMLVTNLKGYCTSCCYSYTKDDISQLDEIITDLKEIKEKEE